MPLQLALPRRIVLSLTILLVVIVGTGAIFVYTPQATVTLYPTTHSQSMTKDIILSGAATEPDFVRFILPAVTAEAEVTAEEKFTRTGEDAGEDFARGEVTLVNESDEPQPLLPKTHLRYEASSVYFLTDIAVTIPAQGMLPVPVTAKEKGSTGNVVAGRFLVDKLPPYTQKLIYGRSEREMTGGLVISQALTEDEIRRSSERVVDKAKRQARGELTAQVGGAALNEELISYEQDSEHVTATVGSKAQAFRIAITIKARALVIDENNILSLALLALRSSASPQEEFLSYQPDSFKLSLKQADFKRREAIVSTSLSGVFAGKIGPAAFESGNLAGLEEQEIKEYFRKFDSIEQVDVDFSPFWVQSVPSRPGAIKIVVKNTNTL